MFTTAKGHFWGDLQLVLFLEDVWNIESYIEIQLVNCLHLCTGDFLTYIQENTNVYRLQVISS